MTTKKKQEEEKEELEEWQGEQQKKEQGIRKNKETDKIGKSTITRNILPHTKTQQQYYH